MDFFKQVENMTDKELASLKKELSFSGNSKTLATVEAIEESRK